MIKQTPTLEDVRVFIKSSLELELSDTEIIGERIIGSYGAKPKGSSVPQSEYARIGFIIDLEEEWDIEIPDKDSERILNGNAKELYMYLSDRLNRQQN